VATEERHAGRTARLEARIEHLERINRWHMASLEMLASMGDMHGDAGKKREPGRIFNMARTHIDRLATFDLLGFLLVNEEDAGFDLVDCAPLQGRERLEQLAHRLIDSGEFAWALHQNRPMFVEVGNGRTALLHVVASRTRVRGVCVGLLARDSDLPSAAVERLISIILYNTAQALESSALYAMVQEHNRRLEAAVAERSRELEHHLGHDALTNLPNRALFLERLRQVTERTRRTQRFVVVMILDLDVFKQVNELFGHFVGDRLLCEVGGRLTAAAQRHAAGDWAVARLGSDEFGVLLGDLAAAGQAREMAAAVAAATFGECMVAGHELYVTGSLGCSVYPNDALDAANLLKYADIAMCRAKRRGRGGIQLYQPEFSRGSRHHLEMERDLRIALRKEQLVLHYQPKVRTLSGGLDGFEALVRWRHPQRGLVSPGEFIPLAEQLGVIGELGEWVLREACRQAREWHRAGLPATVAVNLSPHQFRQRELMQRILAVLDETGLPPRLLELEITESTLMEDVDAAVATLRWLHDAGIQVAVDDFGTGYSSLSYLKRFPIDTLKVDRSFVRDITEDTDDRAIVTAIIAMAHSMALKVVAEGVETAEQLELLRTLGCDVVQGFFYSPGVPAPEAGELLGRGGWAPDETQRCLR